MSPQMTRKVVNRTAYQASSAVNHLSSPLNGSLTATIIVLAVVILSHKCLGWAPSIKQWSEDCNNFREGLLLDL